MRIFNNSFFIYSTRETRKRRKNSRIFLTVIIIAINSQFIILLCNRVIDINLNPTPQPTKFFLTKKSVVLMTNMVKKVWSKVVALNSEILSIFFQRKFKTLIWHFYVAAHVLTTCYSQNYFFTILRYVANYLSIYFYQRRSDVTALSFPRY